MGLLSTEVEVTLNGKNIKYYEPLGYKMPRRLDKYGKYTIPLGTKLKINVGDLPFGSNVKVDVKCDCCGKEYKIDYYDYTHKLHDGKIYCKGCASSILISGEKHYAWRKDRTTESYGSGRNTIPYRDFWLAVLRRDSYSCQCCGKKASNHKIVVHHLNGYSWSIDERTLVQNGISLCEECHKRFHKIYGNKHNTKEQFEEWIGRRLDLLNEVELLEARKIYCIEEEKVYDDVASFCREWELKSESSVYCVCNHFYYVNRENFEHLGINLSTYKNDCTIKGKHLLWYKDYKMLTNEELNLYCQNNIGNPRKKVICITTNHVFNTIASAKKFYGCDSHISDCCRNNRKYCGTLDDGTKLQWMYYEQYLMENNLTEEKASESLIFID